MNNYGDAHKAIQIIVSEGEGSPSSPLDLEHEYAHYDRFEEIVRDRQLVKTNTLADFDEHADAAIITPAPGLGPILAARVLGEIGVRRVPVGADWC